jgi:hypothetical protein
MPVPNIGTGVLSTFPAEKRAKKRQPGRNEISSLKNRKHLL